MLKLPFFPLKIHGCDLAEQKPMHNLLGCLSLQGLFVKQVLENFPDVFLYPAWKRPHWLADYVFSSVKRMHTGQHLVKDYAEGPNIVR